jgi:hypothetical protein
MLFHGGRIRSQSPVHRGLTQLGVPVEHQERAVPAGEQQQRQPLDGRAGQQAQSARRQSRTQPDRAYVGGDQKRMTIGKVQMALIRSQAQNGQAGEVKPKVQHIVAVDTVSRRIIKESQYHSNEVKGATRQAGEGNSGLLRMKQNESSASVEDTTVR